MPPGVAFNDIWSTLIALGVRASLFSKENVVTPEAQPSEPSFISSTGSALLTLLAGRSRGGHGISSSPFWESPQNGHGHHGTNGSGVVPPVQPWWSAPVDLFKGMRSPEGDHALVAGAATMVTGDSLVEEGFRNAAVVVLPGLLNYTPTKEWADTLSRRFGYGGVVIGLGGHAKVEHHKHHSIYGSTETVVQPDWRREMAFVFHRLSIALEDPESRIGQAERLVFVGHSKGGLLAHSLQGLTAMYDYSENNGRFPQQAYNIFPGLDQVEPARVQRVMAALQGGRFHMLAPPVDGVPMDSLVAKGIDAALLRRTGRYYTPDFIANHFERLGLSPEQADSIITVQMPRTVSEDMAQGRVTEGSLGRAIVIGTTRIFFRNGVRYVLQAGPNGDTVVRAIDGYSNHVEMQLRDSHTGILDTVEAANEIFAIIAARDQEPQGEPWTQDSVASHGGVLTRQGKSPEPTSVGDESGGVARSVSSGNITRLQRQGIGENINQEEVSRWKNILHKIMQQLPRLSGLSSHSTEYSALFEEFRRLVTDEDYLGSHLGELQNLGSSNERAILKYIVGLCQVTLELSDDVESDFLGDVHRNTPFKPNTQTGIRPMSSSHTSMGR